MTRYTHFNLIYVQYTYKDARMTEQIEHICCFLYRFSTFSHHFKILSFNRFTILKTEKIKDQSNTIMY
jgi:hypothetical protein